MLTRTVAAIAVVTAVAALGVLFGRALGGDADTSSPATADGLRPAREQSSSLPPAVQAQLRDRLEAGTASAGRLGVEVRAAVWIDGQRDPVVVGAELDQQMRLWSMSKPFAAIAALRAIGSPAPSWVAPELEALLLRSENCPMRALMLELQRRAGSVSAARRALASVFLSGGAGGVTITDEVESPDPECRRRLEANGVPAPESEALLTGTSTWTVEDAVRMTHALAGGRLGAAGELVLDLMRGPKSPSEEISSPSDYTADPEWGAGRVFAGWAPAYKAGWGGVNQGQFMVGQIVIVSVGSRSASVAVMAHPESQPSIDDPGRTQAPRAVETVLRAIRPTLTSSLGR